MYSKARVGLHRALSEQVVVVFLLESDLGSLAHGNLGDDKDDKTKKGERWIIIPISSSRSSQASSDSSRSPSIPPPWSE